MKFGEIVLEGWAGRTRTRVEIVGETPTRYRIRAIERTKLGGAKWIYRGELALVPKRAVRMLDEKGMP